MKDKKYMFKQIATIIVVVLLFILCFFRKKFLPEEWFGVSTFITLIIIPIGFFALIMAVQKIRFTDKENEKSYSVDEILSLVEDTPCSNFVIQSDELVVRIETTSDYSKREGYFDRAYCINGTEYSTFEEFRIAFLEIVGSKSVFKKIFDEV